jgi:hypothetical protein
MGHRGGGGGASKYGVWTIFLLTKGAYSAQICLADSDPFLDDLGREYHVKYVWAYMLFGQLVAISVGMNLFCQCARHYECRRCCG